MTPVLKDGMEGRKQLSMAYRHSQNETASKLPSYSNISTSFLRTPQTQQDSTENVTQYEFDKWRQSLYESPQPLSPSVSAGCEVN